MKATKKYSQRFTYFLLSLLLVACTDRREPERKVPVSIQRAPPQMLQSVGDIRITKGDTTTNITVDQMLQKGGSLFLSGTSELGGQAGLNLGLAKWDITSNPEAPTPQFRFENFKYLDGWRPDQFASGAMAVLGPYLITSGIAGASFINISDNGNPVETKRYPMPPSDPTTGQPQDPKFMYRGIGVHPTLPIIYGLREADYMVVSRVDANGITPVTQIPYGQSTVCCVQGTTVFDNRMYVAMRGMLRTYQVSADGSLAAPVDLHNIQALNVASTSELLYVQHEPSFGVPGGRSRAGGIYVFDKTGNSIAYLPVRPKRFSVSDDNTHLYANMDDTAVRIFRIEWTNQ